MFNLPDGQQTKNNVKCGGIWALQKGEKFMASEDNLVSKLSQISYGTLSFICGGKKRKREGKMILNEKSGF